MDSSSTHLIAATRATRFANNRAKERLRTVDVFILVLGFFSSFYVNVVGQLYITEIILVMLFPFLWLRHWVVLRRDRLASRILFFGGLWFISQAFTDLVRSTPLHDMLRGWAGILVFLSAFGALYLLTQKNIRRIQIFVLGYALGVIASLYLQPPYYFPAEPWKFGFGYPATLLVLLLISHTSSKNFGNLRKWVLPLLLLGGVSIYLNARSLGAIIILSALMLWLRNQSIGRAILTRISLQSILAGGLIVGLTIWGLISVYGLAAQRGYLGEAAKLKYTWQESGRFGLLLGGRSEILASAIAIRDSPIIGHGSWAKDPAYRILLYQLLDLGYQLSPEALHRYINESDLIPAHSHFFQAWVWGGILGAVFWLMILGMIIKELIQSNRFPDKLHIFIIFFSISSIWDILFSPFTSIMRLRWAFQLIIFITAYYRSQQLEQAS